MSEPMLALLSSTLGAILAGFAGLVVAIVVYLVFAKLLARLIGRGWSRFVGGLLAIGVIAGTVVVMLDITGATGTLVAIATALTGAVAIGSEGIASDFIAGLKMFTGRPFRTGDLVQAGGHQGTVKEILLTNTILISASGERIVIRNSDVLAGTIVNYSTRAGHMVSVQVSVSASEDLEKVIAVILAALKDFSPESARLECVPGVACEAVAGGQMMLVVRAYVGERTDHNEEKTRLLLKTLQALKKSKINYGG